MSIERPRKKPFLSKNGIKALSRIYYMSKMMRKISIYTFKAKRALSHQRSHIIQKLPRDNKHYNFNGDEILLTLTAMDFKAMLDEIRVGESSPSRSESTRAPAIPIFANIRA